MLKEKKIGLAKKFTRRFFPEKKTLDKTNPSKIKIENESDVDPNYQMKPIKEKSKAKKNANLPITISRRK